MNKSVAILPNVTRDINLEYTNKLAHYLKQNHCHVYIEPEYEKKITEEDVIFKKIEDFHKTCDCVIVLGGDGTILSQAYTASKFNLPILGINLGSVGYLTDVDKRHAFEAIDNYLQDAFIIEKRMMIDTKLGRKVMTALNEICVIKGIFSKIITFDTYVNGEYIDTYRADGIIVSTPSGSTAYNLAAGGPIIKPDLDVMVITPICPYKLITRPLVVSGEDKVEIKLQSYNNVVVSVDGISKNLDQDILISKSEHALKLIKTNNDNFHHTLRNKLGTL